MDLATDICRRSNKNKTKKEREKQHINKQAEQ